MFLRNPQGFAETRGIKQSSVYAVGNSVNVVFHKICCHHYFIFKEVFMIRNIAYQITEYTAPVSEQKMHFNIINRLPQYPAAERESMRAEIEKQLFAIFCKYEYAHERQEYSKS